MRNAAALLLMLACACAQTATAPSPVPSAAPTPTSSPSPSPSPSPTPSPPPVPQKAESRLPEVREETAAAAAGGRLYVMGGFDSAGRSSRGVFVFDGASWTAGPPLPIGLDHPSAAALGDDLYLAGGFSGGPASARVFKLPAGAAGWSEVASLHHARGALALIPVDGTLYAVGGNNGSVQVAPGEIYDAGGNAWLDIAPLPLPRNHVAGFSFERQACVAGGRTPNTARVDCFDPATSSWRRLPDLPQPTSGAGAAVVNGQVVVAGGENAQESFVVDQLARFQAGAWIQDRMLVPRHGIQLAPFNGRAWACGGATQAGLHPVAECTSIA